MDGGGDDDGVSHTFRVGSLDRMIAPGSVGLVGPLPTMGCSFTQQRMISQMTLKGAAVFKPEEKRTITQASITNNGHMTPPSYNRDAD